jgi:signal transduction histidine kinase
VTGATVIALREDAALGPGGLSPGDLAELMAAFNDVTARLQRTHESLRDEVARLNAELRQANEQLERSRRLAGLGQMAAGIAHEVRNPLGSIGLYARMLVEDLADRPQERLVAGKIADAVRGLDGVVGDVLNFARQLRVRPVAGSAAEVMERALEACRPAGIAPADGIVVRRRGLGRAATVYGDPTLMHQALVNVIRNAMDALTESGSARVLTLGVSARRLGEAGSKRPAVGLWVADTGPGVNAEVIERMFNPFFTTRAAGTGLGLAIVHRIVDAHGGRVEVRNNAESDPRTTGTTVELILPAAGGAEVDERSGGSHAAQESHA